MKFEGITIKIANEERPKPDVDEFKKRNIFDVVNDFFAPYKKIFNTIEKELELIRADYQSNPTISQEKRIEDLNKITSYMEEIAKYQGSPGYETIMKKLIDLESTIDTPAFERN